MAFLGPLTAGLELIGGINRTLSNRDKIKELENRGVNIPFHQKFLPQLFAGPSVGGRFQEASLGRKLERTADFQIPTRSSVGLDGDAAFAQTANIFRQQLAKQLATQTTSLNREFSTAGRFDSGQRLEAIRMAQESARGQFGQFLSSTALERFMQQQRLQTQADIAQSQIEAQRGGGRTQLFGQGIGALARIFAANPEFFINLFGGGSGGGGGGSANTLAFRDLKEG